MIPFRSLLAKITNLPSSLQPYELHPRPQGRGVPTSARSASGDVICYEVGFDGLVGSEVQAGANLLAVQTNDADFELDGQTGETLQQLDMARIRAIEHDRAVVVASTTGVSAIIAPDGDLMVATRTWQRAEIEARVPLLTSRPRWPTGSAAGPRPCSAGSPSRAMVWAAAGTGALRRRAQVR